METTHYVALTEKELAIAALAIAEVGSQALANADMDKLIDLVTKQTSDTPLLTIKSEKASKTWEYRLEDLKTLVNKLDRSLYAMMEHSTEAGDAEVRDR